MSKVSGSGKTESSGGKESLSVTLGDRSREGEVTESEEFTEEEGEDRLHYLLGPEDEEEEDEDGSGGRGPKEPKEVVLTKDLIRLGLSMIGRTVDNFQYAYIRYDGSNRHLCNVDALADYPHLRILILSENRIRSLLPICPLKHMLVLNAHTNLLESFEEIPTWPYLQALSLMSNRLSSLKGLYANHIIYLQLSFNGFDKLEDFNASTFYALRTLELRGNQMASLEGLSIPTLEHLFAAQNLLREITGLNCPNLVTLHLRDNVVTKLDSLPSLPKLKYLNLRSNLVSRFTQTVHLDKVPNLTVLILAENPLSGSESYRLEMLAVLPLLTRIDKLLCTEAEIIDGRSLCIGREKHVEGVAPLEDDMNIVTPVHSPHVPIDEDGGTVADYEEGDEEGAGDTQLESVGSSRVDIS